MSTVPIERAIVDILDQHPDLTNKVVVALLEDQAKIVEHLINRYGPVLEDIRTLTALREIIDYNSIPE